MLSYLSNTQENVFSDKVSNRVTLVWVTHSIMDENIENLVYRCHSMEILLSHVNSPSLILFPWSCVYATLSEDSKVTTAQTKYSINKIIPHKPDLKRISSVAWIAHQEGGTTLRNHYGCWEPIGLMI